MTYEKDMMRAEVFWYRQMREHTPITVPDVYFEDFERKQIPTDYFIMEKLSGKQLDQMKFSGSEQVQSNSITATMAAQIHKIKNDQFGYIQNGLYDNWYQAIRAMTQSLLDDCARAKKKSKRGEKLLACIDRYQDVLKKRNVAWSILIFGGQTSSATGKTVRSNMHGSTRARSFWGDRIADFVCLEYQKPLEKKKASLAAYNAVADEPIRVTREEKIRYAVMQGYLGLIQEVEKYYRYTPKHFGWWRNVFSSAWFYKSAFGGLK